MGTPGALVMTAKKKTTKAIGFSGRYSHERPWSARNQQNRRARWGLSKARDAFHLGPLPAPDTSFFLMGLEVLKSQSQVGFK